MNAKNATFFYNEHKKTQEHSCSFIKNAKEHAFFYKKRKITQDNEHSLTKNAKECKRMCVLLQRTQRSVGERDFF